MSEPKAAVAESRLTESQGLLGDGRDASVRYDMWEGLRIARRECGDGAITLILIHGWACDSSTWMPLLRRLPPQTVTAIAPDLPGFGSSSWRAPWTFETCSGVIVDIVRQVPRDRPVVLCGHSMGGAVALLAAARLSTSRPANHVILEAYAPLPPFRGPRVERIRQLKAEGTGGTWFADVVRSWYVSGISPPDLQAAVGVGRAVASEVLIESQEEVLRGLGPEVVRAADERALWIFGAKDTNRDLARVRAAAAARRATLRVIPGCGHMPHYEFPGAVASIIADRCEALT